MKRLRLFRATIADSQPHVFCNQCATKMEPNKSNQNGRITTTTTHPILPSLIKRRRAQRLNKTEIYQQNYKQKKKILMPIISYYVLTSPHTYNTNIHTYYSTRTTTDSNCDNYNASSNKRTHSTTNIPECNTKTIEKQRTTSQFEQVKKQKQTHKSHENKCRCKSLKEAN